MSPPNCIEESLNDEFYRDLQMLFSKAARFEIVVIAVGSNTRVVELSYVAIVGLIRVVM